MDSFGNNQSKQTTTLCCHWQKDVNKIMSKELIGYNDKIKTIKEQARLYISTPERAAEALLFVRELEKFAEEIKGKIKERTIEIMDKSNSDLITYTITDPTTGEIREWEVKRDYGSQSKEYRPENVIGALGAEKAIKFMKVSKTELDKYLKRETAKGAMPMELMEMAVKDPIIKTRKGAGVKMREIKPIT